MIDFPEMFIFSAPFIKLHNPEAKIYLYDKENFTPEFVTQQLPEYDFAFIPNYAMSELLGLSDMLFMINILSFQEMTGAQVDNYLQFAYYNVKYGVYSDNYDCYLINNSDLGSVTTRMEKHFKLFPAPEKYADLVTKRGKITNFSQFRRFIALKEELLLINFEEFSEESRRLEEGLKAVIK